MSKRMPLNIPKSEDKFRDVEFVREMTPGQLKVLVKRMWNNIQDLATELEKSRKDIPGVLDSILDGDKWDEAALDDRVHYGRYKGFVIAWDSLEKTFTLMDEDYSPIEKPIRAVSRSELLRELKDRARGKK